MSALAALALLAIAGGGCGGARRTEVTSALGAPPPLIAVSSRLLGLRAADPEGGLPWGIRLVYTNRSWICVQVGRVSGGRLGQLGLDGAYGDDHAFHPLSVDALPALGAPGIADDAACVASTHTFAGELDGIDRNAELNPAAGALPLRFRRTVSFGLLGRHALALTYRADGQLRTGRMLVPLGAYLLVTSAEENRFLGRADAAPGSDEPRSLQPAGLTGALATVTYRYGRHRCLDTGENPIDRLCGLSRAADLRR